MSCRLREKCEMSHKTQTDRHNFLKKGLNPKAKGKKTNKDKFFFGMNMIFFTHEIKFSRFFEKIPKKCENFKKNVKKCLHRHL